MPGLSELLTVIADELAASLTARLDGDLVTQVEHQWQALCHVLTVLDTLVHHHEKESL